MTSVFLHPTRTAVSALLTAFILILYLGMLPVFATGKDTYFNPEVLEEIDDTILDAIDKKQIPGGILWMESKGQVYRKTFGRRMSIPFSHAMLKDTIFDMASITKVMATTSCIMKLVETGKVELEKPVRTYIPEFTGDGKDSITVRQLMTHTSGMRPGIIPRPAYQGYANGFQRIFEDKPLHPPGSIFKYSDINFILLGEIVKRASGKTLDEFSRTEIFAPLGMKDTSFLPPENKRWRVAPTTKEPAGLVQGVVHDPTSRRMGGVTGHAGLFSTIEDVATFARMMLGKGALGGTSIFNPKTVALMTSPQNKPPVTVARGLGWDVNSGYAGPRGEHFTPGESFGHTGWTGTSLWIIPKSETFIIFLANRNHPTEQGKTKGLRYRLGTLAAEALPGFVDKKKSVDAKVEQAIDQTEAVYYAAAGPLSGKAAVLNGIDVLEQSNFQQLKGKRIGLITNHTGINRKRVSSIDLLHQAADVNLTALFSPEHGIRGKLEGNIASSRDKKTGLPIHSLYGKTRQPTADQLKGLDVLIFDIQDIGCRFYTYVSTMGLAMEAAAKAGIKFVVLDRINPIGGLAVDGPVRDGEQSFVAFHNIPVRHGMTAGELARMFKVERKLGKLDLEIIRLQNWKRSMLFHETGLPWINPSPNMRSLDEAILYPGVGLLEFMKISVGRGTKTPFELVGAPYLVGTAVAAELNALKLPGVRFKAETYTPNASVFMGKRCGGIRITLTDRRKFSSVITGIAIARTLHKRYADKMDYPKYRKLLVHPATWEAVKAAKSLQQIQSLWTKDLAAFQKRRASYLLYR